MAAIRKAAVLLAGALTVTAAAPPARATHPGASLPVEVDGERLEATRDPAGCVVGGTVRNPSPRTVTVRLAFRASDRAGATLAFATARIARLSRGERRPFTSSPLVSMADGQTRYACPAVHAFELLEAFAEPSP